MWVWQSPWLAMPRKHIPNDSPLSLTGRSCIRVMKCKAGLGLSGPAALLMGIAIDTVRPLRTRRAAAATLSGVR